MIHLVDDYLAIRRAVGFKLRATESRLRSFARYARKRGDTCIRAETAVAWAGTADSPHERHSRLRTIVLFARHLRAEDPRHEVPRGDLYPFTYHQRLPHIFSGAEIRLILDAAGRLGPSGSSRADTYRTLLALLVVTGLRISEALALQLRDLTDDGLVVRNTKFRKCRLVPVHPTTRVAITAYCMRWRVVTEPDEPLFVSTLGTALVYATVYRTFVAIVRQLGMRVDPIPGSHRRSSACLQDFRHTLATRTLEGLPGAARASIGRHMLALSTYLGHSKISSTYWYLHSTPELMVDIADACEAFLAGGAR